MFGLVKKLLSSSVATAERSLDVLNHGTEYLNDELVALRKSRTISHKGNLKVHELAKKSEVYDALLNDVQKQNKHVSKYGQPFVDALNTKVDSVFK